MLYNKYRRQWLAFVIVVVGRRRYRGRVVMVWVGVCRSLLT